MTMTTIMVCYEVGFTELMFYPPTLQGLDDQDGIHIDSSDSYDHMAAVQDSDCGLLSGMVQKFWPFSHPISSAVTYYSSIER